MEEIVRKSRKDKYTANQKIEIGETSVQRPERMPLQMLQKRQKSTKQIATKKKKTELYCIYYLTLGIFTYFIVLLILIFLPLEE